MATALSTDLYEITMAAGYAAAGLTGQASFELSGRTLPAERSYLIAAGLEPVLEYLEAFEFSGSDIAYLRRVPGLRDVPEIFFDEVLPSLRFTGDVWAMPEGTAVFPHEPMLRVTAPLIEAQLVETALLAMITFQTSVASRAARMVDAAAGRPVYEFGARRAHGTEAGVLAARAAFIGGCRGTSMVEAGRCYELPLAGTMAHSWVMCFETETEAYQQYMDLYGEQAVLLIDTYDSVTAADRIVTAGLRPWAVRIDSGDLVNDAKKVRACLDGGGLHDTSILVSGDLDEFRISALVAEDVPIDGFGVGNALSTASDAPALGGVYKMVEVERQGTTRQTLKLSRGKITYPGRKQVYRFTDERGVYTYDRLELVEDGSPKEGRPLLTRVMAGGRRTRTAPGLVSIQRCARNEVDRLPAALRGLQASSENYTVRRSENLDQLTADLGRKLPRACR